LSPRNKKKSSRLPALLELFICRRKPRFDYRLDKLQLIIFNELPQSLDRPARPAVTAEQTDDTFAQLLFLEQPHQ
jgi:hypothetical protein